MMGKQLRPLSPITTISVQTQNPKKFKWEKLMITSIWLTLTVQSLSKLMKREKSGGIKEKWVLSGDAPEGMMDGSFWSALLW